MKTESASRNKWLRWLFIPVIAFMLVFLLSGCGNKNTPENTVEELFKSAKDFDIEKFESLVADEVKNDLNNSLNEYTEGIVDTNEDEEIDYELVEGYEDVMVNLKDIQSDLSYKIIDSEEMEDSAFVTLDVEFVDGQELVSNVASDLMGEFMTQIFSGEELSEEESMSMMAQAFNKNYAIFDKELITQTVSVRLIKDEEGQWLLSEIEDDLSNALMFNFIEGVDNMFSGMFGGFED